MLAGDAGAVALLSATVANRAGTLAAVALVRFGRFQGPLAVFRHDLRSAGHARCHIPGCRCCFCLLPSESRAAFWTIVLAHITFSMCYVAVVIQSRLVTFDRSLEEAAEDLGCPPLKTFMVITLPIILPAVVPGWMLGFTLSLDDLVIASFTTGPGATTLPMKIYSQVDSA